jgi:hypothetical protein
VDFVALDTDVASRIVLHRLTGTDSPARSCIAAHCLAHGFPLATLNTKDFLDLADHEGLSLQLRSVPWALTQPRDQLRHPKS